MGKLKTIDTFFKRKDDKNQDGSTTPIMDSSHPTPSHPTIEPSNINPSCLEPNSSIHLRLNATQMDACHLERDHGLRPLIWEFSINQRDEIHRAYLKAGPNQPRLPQDAYPFSFGKKQRRQFQFSWFDLYPSWLEYSKAHDAIYCLSCYIFGKQSSSRPGSNTFIEHGFRNWKKVNNGSDCALLNHVGKGPNSPHYNAVKCCDDLMKQSQHIDTFIKRQASEEIENNRLRLRASIDCIEWLTFQGCAYRGHDESQSSKNRGNFIEMLKFLGSYNDNVQKLVLENAPKVARYTSSDIQKDILHILANKVRNAIRDEIGDAKFCILIDEARDESKKEQMAIVLRFVSRDGFIQERFFDIEHVTDTCAMTLKKGLESIFSRHNLMLENIRGQGYDGASNMRGEWNGLQALVLKDCPYAYYVHCFAHRLQLALVAASREVIQIHEFFTQLTSVVNIVGASSKQHDQLQTTQANEIAKRIALGELETGRGANQVGTLQRAGDTRRGSHFNSICSLMTNFSAACTVVEKIIEEGATYAQRGDAYAASKVLLSFEFVFTMHLMHEIMGITNDLCQALQQHSQDILNAMNLVSTTKSLLQRLRDDEWPTLLENVKLFCSKYEIGIPDMDSRYILGRGRSRQPKVTMEHHFQIEVFLATIDPQLQELNNRFNEQTMELLTLSSNLDPNEGYKSFNIENLCKLALKFYPRDFTEQERSYLKFQLRHYELDISSYPDFQGILTLSQLCRRLMETRKSKTYHLVDRLIRLVLTLPVSAATTERAFSAMKTIKTRLWNKMDDEFLADNLVVYIEKEIATTFSTNSIIVDFESKKKRRVEFS